MAFANVNIGSTASDGTGDPLRNAFNKINQNFANIAAGAVTVNAPVKSVAGRTGNVRLVVSDVTGAASNAYVNTTVTTANTGMKSYVDTLAFGGGTGTYYTNANVAEYLPTHTGNVGAGNVVSRYVYGNVMSPYQDRIVSVGNLDNLIVTGPTTLRGNLIFTTGELVTKDLYVSGNLFIAGNRTDINIAHISTVNRHVILVSDITDDAQATGAGFMTPFSAWTFQHTFAGWESNVNIVPAAHNTYNLGGAIGWAWANVYSGNVHATGNVIAGNVYGTIRSGTQLNITGLGTLANLTVGGDVEVFGNTQIWSDVFINGANTYVADGNVTMLGNVTLGRYGTEFGATTVIVSSFAEFRDNVVMYSNLTTGTADSTLNVIGNLSVDGNILYTMGNAQNWTSDVHTVSSALDQLAQRLKAAGF